MGFDLAISVLSAPLILYHSVIQALILVKSYLILGSQLVHWQKLVKWSSWLNLKSYWRQRFLCWTLLKSIDANMDNFACGKNRLHCKSMTVSPSWHMRYIKNSAIVEDCAFSFRNVHAHFLVTFIQLGISLARLHCSLMRISSCISDSDHRPGSKFFCFPHF